ncbi:MAG: serine--tRNA ligase [Candidatus Moraniibacteriota bacterium]|nr:MAG: serine--tRNA ligase [Candidatus Moranbacteria bacterium]
MLDIKYIRGNADKVQKAAENKNIEIDVKKFLILDQERVGLIKEIEALQEKKNKINTQIKEACNDQERKKIIAKGKEIKEKIDVVKLQVKDIEERYNTLIKKIPNIPTEDTPIGKTEDENVVVYEWGKKPELKFDAKNHWELAQNNDWIDKERAAKVTGARFAYLKGDLVILQLALMQYVMDTLTDEEKIAEIVNHFDVGDIETKPFTPVFPPFMIRTEMFDAMDRLEPRDDRYKIEGEDLWLQGSAEHVLGALHCNEILNEEDLPFRYIGYATSFRREAGTYGKDMEGIIRMHQFDKLEMEIIATPEQGLNEHFLTIAVQEYLLRNLKLPYRKLLKCTADIGKPNVRGVDMDVWLPGQKAYRETHTADYMTDYQSRRLKTRVRLADGTLAYVHTIDATAFACGRALVAILENFQQTDGSVVVPEALRPYMSGGKDKITKK